MSSWLWLVLLLPLCCLPPPPAPLPVLIERKKLPSNSTYHLFLFVLTFPNLMVIYGYMTWYREVKIHHRMSWMNWFWFPTGVLTYTIKFLSWEHYLILSVSPACILEADPFTFIKLGHIKHYIQKGLIAVYDVNWHVHYMWIILWIGTSEYSTLTAFILPYLARCISFHIKYVQSELSKWFKIVRYSCITSMFTSFSCVAGFLGTLLSINI